MPLGPEEEVSFGPALGPEEEVQFGPEEEAFPSSAPPGRLARALEAIAPHGESGRREGFAAGVLRQFGVDRSAIPQDVQITRDAAEMAAKGSLGGFPGAGPVAGAIIGEIAEAVANFRRASAEEASGAERVSGAVGTVPLFGTSASSMIDTFRRGDIKGGAGEAVVALPIMRLLRAAAGSIGGRQIQKALIEAAHREALQEAEERTAQELFQAEVAAPARELPLARETAQDVFEGGSKYIDPEDPVARQWDEFERQAAREQTPEVQLGPEEEVSEAVFREQPGRIGEPGTVEEQFAKQSQTFEMAPEHPPGDEIPRAVVDPVRERAAKQGRIPEASEGLPPGEVRAPGNRGRTRPERLPRQVADQLEPPREPEPVRYAVAEQPRGDRLATAPDDLPPGTLSEPGRPLPKSVVEGEAFKAPELASPAAMDRTLTAAVKAAQAATSQTVKLRRAEQAKRFAAAESELTRGGGLDEARNRLAGALPTGANSAIELTEEQARAYVQMIRESGLNVATKLRAQDGLRRLSEGRVLKQSEIDALRRIFPETAAVAEETAQQASRVNWGLALLDIQRSLFAGGDYSPLLRQMGIPVSGNPRMAAGALKRGLQIGGIPGSFGKKATDRSRAAMIEFLSELEKHPNRELWDKSGLQILGATEAKTARDIAAQEGFGVNPILNKVPVLGPAYENLNRGNAALISKMRTDYFNALAEPFLQQGKSFNSNPEIFRSIAEWVNVSTGRGSLGSFEKMSGMLSPILFSPRYLAARVQLLGGVAGAPFGKGVVARLPKGAQQKALTDIGAWIGQRLAVISALAASKKAGSGIKVETDPRSADFGKVRQGEATLDLWGGHAQTVRTLARLVLWAGGQATREKASGDRVKESAAEVGAGFLSNLLNPGTAFLLRQAQQKGGPSSTVPGPLGHGDENAVMAALAESFPSIVQAADELSKKQPDAAWMVPFAFAGAGTQTYPGPAELTEQERGQLREKEAIEEKNVEIRKDIEVKKGQQPTKAPAEKLVETKRTNIRLEAVREILSLLEQGKRNEARRVAARARRESKGKVKIDVNDLASILENRQ